MGEKVMSRGVKNSHLVYTKPDIEEYGYFPIYIEKGIGDEFDVYRLQIITIVNKLHTLSMFINFNTFYSG